ncbi:MAG: putative flap endonuclease-1-like 5' DNA nuclease [Candidatus Paceibacteria bacterium]|jgi:predicted flap endonuclease-1-like 5' DNA nuclease
MEWLTQQIIILTPLALIVLLFAAMCVGWVVYGLRGYKHWFKRFHRYHNMPSRRHMRRSHRYVEYVPEVTNQPVMARPQARAPQIIHKRMPLAQAQQLAHTVPLVEQTITPAPLYSTKDDLQVIEGIGPKVESILNTNGVHTWRELSQTPTQNIKTMLERAGLMLQDPTTWSKQANMADTGMWDDLRKWQDVLHGGITK